MNETFNFSILSTKDKKKFIFHKILILFGLVLATLIAIWVTDPVVIGTSDQINVTIGAGLAIFVFILALSNRIKTLLKVKFLLFIILWVLFLSLSSIIDTLIWSFGLNAIPLMIDDLLVLPYWKKVWYNIYER